MKITLSLAIGIGLMLIVLGVILVVLYTHKGCVGVRRKLARNKQNEFLESYDIVATENDGTAIPLDPSSERDDDTRSLEMHSTTAVAAAPADGEGNNTSDDAASDDLDGPVVFMDAPEEEEKRERRLMQTIPLTPTGTPSLPRRPATTNTDKKKQKKRSSSDTKK